MTAAGVLILYLFYAYWPQESAVIVSPETTCITGPLHKDGTVNYVQALIDRFSEGVTPQANAAVPLVRALGPKIFAKCLREESLRQLSLTHEQLAADEPFFVDFATFGAITAGADPRQWGGLSDDELNGLIRSPWSADDYPLVAAWLATNARCLDLLVEASNREHIYLPIVPLKDPPRMLGLSGPNLAALRYADDALFARAMLHLKHGNVDAARRDVMAGHRLARLLARTPHIPIFLVGQSAEASAWVADEAILTSDVITPDQLRGMLSDIQALPPMPTCRELLTAERFRFLDSVVQIHREGLGPILPVPDGQNQQFAHGSMSLDWNGLLREFNGWWDRYDQAYLADSYADHLRLTHRFEVETNRRFRLGARDDASRETEMMKLGIASAGGRPFRGVRTRAVGRLIMITLHPNRLQIRTLCELRRMQRAVVEAALAAQVYKADHGHYPPATSMLVPDYLPALPIDRFTRRPLEYGHTPEGVRIYSLGPNMNDDDGHNTHDDSHPNCPADADDIAIELK
jgi:hypothetical protein